MQFGVSWWVSPTQRPGAPNPVQHPGAPHPTQYPGVPHSGGCTLVPPTQPSAPHSLSGGHGGPAHQPGLARAHLVDAEGESPRGHMAALGQLQAPLANALPVLASAAAAGPALLVPLAPRSWWHKKRPQGTGTRTLSSSTAFPALSLVSSPPQTPAHRPARGSRAAGTCRTCRRARGRSAGRGGSNGPRAGRAGTARSARHRNGPGHRGWPGCTGSPAEEGTRQVRGVTPHPSPHC